NLVRDAVVLLKPAARRATIAGSFAVSSNRAGHAVLSVPISRDAIGKRLYLQVVAKTSPPPRLAVGRYRGEDAAGSVSQITTAAELLRPYVPRILIAWLRETPDERHKAIDGSMAFVDISGFTKLTERLARKGKVGSEEISDT